MELEELSPKKHNQMIDVDDNTRRSRLATHFLLMCVHKSKE